MPTRVKICGITRREDAELAVELGAAALGFNFYPRSPRYITPVAARDIIGSLPPFAVAVGVFADETDAAHLNSVAEEAGVSVVQLHGPKVPADDGIGRFPVIRAIAMRPSEVVPGAYDGVPVEGLPDRIRQLLGFPPQLLGPKDFRACAYLLDTGDPVLRGGTGRTFDWKSARQIALTYRVILAGGLTQENVAEAIKEVRPYAVDVASGVECAPGLKDLAKLRAFFAAVKDADQMAEAITQ